MLHSFFAVGLFLFVAMPEMFYSEGRVVWTGRIIVKVISDPRQNAFLTYIIRDQCFRKMEFIFQKAIALDGVKG